MFYDEEKIKFCASEIWDVLGHNLVSCFLYIAERKAQELHSPDLKAYNRIVVWERVEAEVIHLARRSGLFGRSVE